MIDVSRVVDVRRRTGDECWACAVAAVCSLLWARRDDDKKMDGKNIDTHAQTLTLTYTEKKTVAAACLQTYIDSHTFLKN